jgi:hypothetical protein
MASPSVSFTATAQGSYSPVVVRDHRELNTPAAAQPEVYYRDRPIVQPAPQPIYVNNDNDYNDRRVWRGEPMPPVYRPVTLAAGMHFANDGRSFITVGGQEGRFGALQISAAGGRTFIQQVYVQFENGQSQVIRNIDRTLVGNESLTLDLDGGRRAIRRIVVYGNPLNRGWGWNGWRRAAGTFTVTAL